MILTLSEPLAWLPMLLLLVSFVHLPSYAEFSPRRLTRTVRHVRSLCSRKFMCENISRALNMNFLS